MKSRTQALVVVLALCGTLGCSAGSPEDSPASPAPAPEPRPRSALKPGPETTLSEGKPDYPDPPGLESLSSMDELQKAPTFTPFTARPDLKNREWIARMLEEEYPPHLREQRVGGRALVWFFLDAEGQVRKIQINESSGNREMDQAALKVAAYMEFTPAYNKDKPVPVWISVPVTFSVRR